MRNTHFADKSDRSTTTRWWLLLIVGCFCVTLQSTPIPSRRTILVFGDSLSAAYNIPLERGWVSLLQDFVAKNHPDYQVVNASISGETTSGGLMRFAAQIEKYQPTIVILELGGNDGLRGMALTETRNNLEQMIKMAKAQGSQILLAGIRLPPNYGRTYTRLFEQIFPELAQQQGATLIPFILEPVATNVQLMQSDGIHPTAEGQPLILQLVLNYLTPLITQQPAN